ncbi:MAG: ABC transporter substrate-binding protein [Spirochaetia bacterium]|jgi:iron complex transport system substrate-binding protein|nr:ABC transporter substrate-binding protein [Spirochaetia bacterium]
MRKYILLPVFLLCSCLQLAAMGTTEHAETGNSFTDSYGRTVTIPANPQKIVTIGPNLTEILTFLGMEDKIVGVTDYDDWPATITHVTKIGSITSPDLEKIIALSPDLVLASTHCPQKVVDALSQAGIPAFAIYHEGNLEATYLSIEDVGAITGKSQEAEKIVRDMKDKITAVQEKVAGLAKPTVYYMISYGQWGDFTAGGNTFIGNMLDIAGGLNIAQSVSGWSYSQEKLIEEDPDMVLCSKSGNVVQQFSSTFPYSDLSAVKNHKVYAVDTDRLDRQTPRNAEAVEALAKIFHPDAF